MSAITCESVPGLFIPNTLLLPAEAGERIAIDRLDPHIWQSSVLTDWLADSATLVVGGGSNLLFVDSCIERIVQIRAHARRVTHQGTDVVLLVDAGHGLDELVRWTAEQGWYGLERLAEIPGTVGAAPIQNVGAYGAEIADVLTHVEVWDREQRQLRSFSRAECHFRYRDSRFKAQPDRWLILRVGLRLTRLTPAVWPPLDYPGLQAQADLHAPLVGRAEWDLTPLDIADIVAAVRRQKLPDWRSGKPPGSAGSFFKNPLIPRAHATALQERYPTLPVYEVGQSESVKISAAWLIEQSGWRGRAYGRVGVYERHALVLINHGGATGLELWELAERIMADVKVRFDVLLEPEPRAIHRNRPA